MSLLEVLASLVILATTAVGFLEVFHATSRATRNASEWTQLSAFAESVMEETKLGAADRAGRAADAPTGFAARVETRAWAPGVSEVIVVATSRNGERLELHRLTRDAAGTPRPSGGPR
jgi:Tfp pilus assembly protein PilV